MKKNNMNKLSSPFALIKKSFDIFSKKENVVFFLKAYLPIGLLSLLSLIFIYIPALSAFFDSQQGKIIINIFNVIFLLATVFVNLAGIIAISSVLKGDKLELKKTFKTALKKYWKFLLLSVLVYVLYILGFVLLVFPFILFSTWFIFSKFILIEEKTSIKFTLKESKRLVKGIFWKTFIRNVVFGLFYVLSSMIFSTLPYGTGTVIFSLLGALYILPTYLLYKEISQKQDRETLTFVND